MTKPSPYELWRQAGGNTPRFSRERYRELLLEHGHLVPLKPGEKPEPLPCGWPHVSGAPLGRAEEKATVEAVVATLRVVAGWQTDESDADELRGVANQVRSEADAGELADWSCPVCQEVECDDDCPLRPVRRSQQPGPVCEERWSDEVGCVNDQPHECPRVGDHVTHRCAWCDSLMLDWRSS